MFLSRAALLASAAQAALAAGSIASYWGNGGYTPDDGSLAEWCTNNEHLDVIMLAFLTNWGNGQYPSGTIQNCQVNSDGTSSGCEQLEKDIGTCQAAGKKIFISLGGGGDNSFGATGTGDAKGVAYSLWNSWASPDAVDSGTKRPLGNIRIDGWDFDLESDPHNEDNNGNLALLINTLRGYFSRDSKNTYYISGAPQCPIPDQNIGKSIQNAQYDYLWIQFYNNNCAAADVYKNSNDNSNGAGSFNFGDWPDYISGGASQNAKLRVGLPGNTAEDGPDSGVYDFVQASDLPKVYNAAKGVKGFDGFMVYEVGDTKSDGTQNGCDYFQSMYSVLTTGHVC